MDYKQKIEINLKECCLTCEHFDPTGIKGLGMYPVCCGESERVIACGHMAVCKTYLESGITGEQFIDNFLNGKYDEVNETHGEWEEADDGDGVVCSVCGTDYCTLVFETHYFMYCPHCGAKMDGEKE